MTGFALLSLVFVLSVFSMVACVPTGEIPPVGSSDSAQTLAANEANATYAAQELAQLQASATAAVNALYTLQTSVAPVIETEKEEIRQTEAALMQMLCIPMLGMGLLIGVAVFVHLRILWLQNREIRLKELLPLQQEQYNRQDDRWGGHRP